MLCPGLELQVEGTAAQQSRSSSSSSSASPEDRACQFNLFVVCLRVSQATAAGCGGTSLPWLEYLPYP